MQGNKENGEVCRRSSLCVYRQRAGKSYSENNHLLGILVKRQTNKTECGIQKQAYMNTASLLLANVQRQFNNNKKKPFEGTMLEIFGY